MKKTLIISALFIFLCILFTEHSYGIPAFARKYNFSCSVCHYTPPKLKPYGEDFAGNGFQIPDNEPNRAFRKTGDDELLLMKEFPLAARFELYGQYESDREVDPDFRTPWILKIMSGGNIAKNISYYFYYFLSERGKAAGIEDAFIYFNSLGIKDLGLAVGQFQVSDPLFKRELRLENEDYRIYTIKPGKSEASLKYDRGLYLTYGLPTGSDFSFLVFNGSGIETSDIFDTDKYKNFLFRYSQDVTDYFRAGAFGYYGNEKPEDYKNEIWMAGGDLTLHTKYAELNGQYVFRSDDNPDMAMFKPSEHVISQGGFLELLLSPDFEKSKWTGMLLYNKVESDYKGLNYESYTAGLSYNLFTNVHIRGEYTYIKESKKSKFLFGLWTAF